jgi:NADPH:quinone reductase-like Zn-dependent oxidoreductase
MLAAYAARISPDDPLSGLEVGDVAEPEAPAGWVTVTVRATSLNHHDLWSLRGVGLPEDRLPMILGTDAVGVTPDGDEVIIHGVIGDPDAGGGDETLDPRRSLLSERYAGTLAERVAVPRRNLVRKPPELTWAEAASLPTAWLTAYRMLFVKSGARPGDTVLVQGAGGGVATAAIALGKAAGLRIWATSRSEAKRQAAERIGAAATFPTGERLPERVDVVLESVGEATWSHSLRSLKPGGRIVVCGATSGPNPKADLGRVFFTQLDVVGSTMGTRGELESLVAMLLATGVRPVVDSELPLAEAREGLARLAAGEQVGKIVLTNG